MSACGSCGEPAIHVIMLGGRPMPVCLRHLNHWQTPTIVLYDEACGDWQVEFDRNDNDAARVAFIELREHMDWCEDAQRVKDEREIVLRLMDHRW